MEQSRYKQAYQLYSEGLEIDPTNIELIESRFNIFGTLGLDRSKEIKRIIDVLPNSYIGYYLLANEQKRKEN